MRNEFQMNHGWIHQTKIHEISDVSSQFAPQKGRQTSTLASLGAEFRQPHVMAEKWQFVCGICAMVSFTIQVESNKSNNQTVCWMMIFFSIEIEEVGCRGAKNRPKKSNQQQNYIGDLALSWLLIGIGRQSILMFGKLPFGSLYPKGTLSLVDRWPLEVCSHVRGWDICLNVKPWNTFVPNRNF